MDNKTPNGPEVENIKGTKIKYPFSGTAPNLIDKFLVIGYEQKVIEYSSQIENDEPNKYKTRFHFFDFEQRPSIINEICNDYNKDLLDNNLILELIFPNLPKMYFLEKKYLNTKKEPDEELLTVSYSIIFSINPQDNSGSKKSYNGLGYIFYTTVEKKNMGEIEGVLYVPMAYIILSEYPYFYHFNQICKNVYIQMLRENDEIPIDIILYNTVKFAPSPINKCINLYFGGMIGFPEDKDTKYEDILQSLNEPKKKEKGIPSMFFNQLSGYPFLDINLSFIFNLLPTEIIIQVFIFSFLEHDIIFYSSRPEILNMVMYIFSNLNYPFNDSIYYWHLLSVSTDSFMSGSSTFVGKTSSTMTGLLSEYNPDVLTTKKIREHFVLDIDNKNFFFLFQEESIEVQETMDLYSYIKSCTAEIDMDDKLTIKKDKESRKKNYFNDEIQLFESIKNLMEELMRRAKKVTSINYNNDNVERPSFLNKYESESEMECMQANARLQKAFLAFITQIMNNFVSVVSIYEETERDRLSEFNQSFTLSIDFKKDFVINEEEMNKRNLAIKAGKIFKQKFKDSSKYSSFVVNFFKYHDTIDLYKIPYTFINELVYYSHVAVKNNLSEVDVFKLIDQFYGKRKSINFEELMNQKNQENQKKKNKNNEETINLRDIDSEFEDIYSFTFNQFTEYYQKYLRAIFNREQEDDREIFTKVKSGNKKYKKYKRNNFYLSDKILNIYMNYLNNNFVDVLDLFKLKKYEKNKKDGVKVENQNPPLPANLIPNGGTQIIDYYSALKEKRLMKREYTNLELFGQFEFGEITDVIEKNFILEKCFSSYGVIKFSLLNLLAVTRDLKSDIVSNIDVITTICDFCEKTKSLVRKYMNLYINVFKNKKKEIQDERCLSIITTYFTKTNMIPTEETANAMNKIKESTTNNILENTKSYNYDEKNFLKFVEKRGKFAEAKKEDKKLIDFIKTMETIFDGQYNLTSFDKINKLKEEFDKLYLPIYKIMEKAKIPKKNQSNDIKGNKSFIPYTPLGLYVYSNKLLDEFLKKFSLPENKITYIELCEQILSLLFYFKMPNNPMKWMEDYYAEETEGKTSSKERSSKKLKDLINKIEEQKKELNNILVKIIAILYDLFDVVSKKIIN